MKLVKTQDSIGHVLCHDMTQIIPGKKKEFVFRKGHIIKEEDIKILLSMGKDNLYIWEAKEGMLHENEAAEVLYSICKNNYIMGSETKEGKIDISATTDGLFKVNTAILNEINSLGEIIISSRKGNFPVKKGDKLAGMRVIPLIISEDKLKRAKEIANNKPVFSILPFEKKKAVIITTGNEVFYGRIEDGFGPVIREKLLEYDVEVVKQEIINDDSDRITKAIENAVSLGVDIIICTGGMSVDPDDTTPTAIKNSNATVVSYGAPVLPGAMFLLAYTDNNIPIMGLPGCVMYNKRTIFDLILPRVIANDVITESDLYSLGEGGLCLECKSCNFPNCSFGK